MGGSRGGTGGPDPPWNRQIISFCHVEIFRQTPFGEFGPPLRKFSGSAHVNIQNTPLARYTCYDDVC